MHQHALGKVKQPGKALAQRLVTGGLALDVADDAAQIGLELAQNSSWRAWRRREHRRLVLHGGVDHHERDSGRLDRLGPDRDRKALSRPS